MLGKDVEDDLRSIDHAQVEALAEVSRLRGRQVLVEDQEVDVVLEGQDVELSELARADQELRVRTRSVLLDLLYDLDARRPRELLELVHLHLHVFLAAPGGHRDQDGALPLGDLAGAVLAGELLFESPDPVAKIEVELGGRHGIQVLDRLFAVMGRAQRRDVGQSRESGGVRRQAHHGVQPQQHEVVQVVPSQSLVGEVGVDAAQAAQAPRTGAHAAPVGQLDGSGAADHDVGDRAAAVDQDTDLAAALAAEPRHRPRELLVDEAIRGNAAPGEAFELSDLMGLETVCVAEDLDECFLGGAGRPVLGQMRRYGPVTTFGI